MKKYYFLKLVFSFFLITSQTHAAVPDGTVIPAPTLSPLARWVESATGTKIRSLPSVVASGKMLKTSLGLQGVQQARSVAAYLPGRIIINNIVWDDDSLRSVSYLVHEMVHHAQTVSGKRFQCNNAKEKQAYILQNRWLVEHGEDPIYDQDWIEEMSSCSKA